MNIHESLRHAFSPSRPGGTVCVVERRYDRETSHTELCGYPAGHPIHDAPTDVTVPAEGSRERTMERRFLLRGRLQRVAVIATERGLVAAAAEIEKILDEVLRIPTPAEAVTGVSPRRAAAALADVAELRGMRGLPDSTFVVDRLDRIEAALREGTGRR